MLEDVQFELFFHGVGEFHARMRKQLYPVVLKWIVRSGNNHAGLKIILANEAGHAGSGDHSGKGHRRASLRQSRCQERSNVRSGFARVHADKDMSRTMFPLEIRG